MVCLHFRRHFQVPTSQTTCLLIPPLDALPHSTTALLSAVTRFGDTSYQAKRNATRRLTPLRLSLYQGATRLGTLHSSNPPDMIHQRCCRRARRARRPRVQMQPSTRDTRQDRWRPRRTRRMVVGRRGSVYSSNFCVRLAMAFSFTAARTGDPKPHKVQGVPTESVDTAVLSANQTTDAATHEPYPGSSSEISVFAPPSAAHPILPCTKP